MLTASTSASCPGLPDLSPDLLPGVDVQVLEAGCGLELPHGGVDPIFLEGHGVPCEPQGGQLRLQVLQLPGGGKRGWAAAGKGIQAVSGEPEVRRDWGRYTGKRMMERRDRKEGHGREERGQERKTVWDTENDLWEGERRREHPCKQERGAGALLGPVLPGLTRSVAMGLP